MILVLFISGAASVQFGRQPGPSVLAYHHYNAFAFLNQREDFDVLAAGTRTFLSPLIDLPFYFCTTMLPARACGFAAGFVQGLNYVGAIVVAALLLAEPETKRPLSMRLPWVLVAAGALGATSLGLLGGGADDNIVSLFFLVPLFWVCREAERVGTSFPRSVAWILAAGLVVGMGCGLRLTLASFGVAIVLAPVFYPVSPWYRLLLVGFCGLGTAFGVMVTAGLHMLRMYRTFGNPVFPFFNAYFDSPYSTFIGVQDPRYSPANLLEALFYPLFFAFNWTRISDLPFRDFRIPALFVLFLLCSIAWMWRFVRRRGTSCNVRNSPYIPPRVRVFFATLLVAYIVWLTMRPNVYRYIFPIELLSFVAIALMLRYLFVGRIQLVALALLAAVIIPTTSPVVTRHLLWDGKDYISVKLPSSPRLQTGAIVLLAGTAPQDVVTYPIPAFPPSVRFLGVDVIDRPIFAAGESIGSAPPASEADLGPFGPYMRTLITAHNGQVLGMFTPQSRERAIAAFARYGLHYDSALCGQVISNVAATSPLQLCELSRM
jgi:hypothetical protein